MKAYLLTGILAAVAFGTVLAADEPMMPKPQKEHDWLKQFVGDWDMEGECKMPGMTMKTKGTESVKSLGGFWITSEIKGEFGGHPMTGHMTIGYDVAKKHYVGSWVDSSGSHMWTYVGSVDSTGKILTLEAEGPSFTDPKKMCKYKDITEFVADGHRKTKTMMQGDDGQWSEMMSMEAKRKK